MMTRTTSLAATALLVGLASTVMATATAWAVPMQLAHQGRLLGADAAPLDGTHTLSFALYDAEQDGAVVWSEDIETVMTGGFYSVVLGADEADNPLDDLVLGGGPLWLELRVDGGEPLEPRHQLLSVPFAVMAGTATNVDGGAVDATEVAIDGEVVIDSEGNWTGPTITVDFGDLTGVPDTAWDDLDGVPEGFLDGEDADALVGLSCADGARPRWDGVSGIWVCDTVSWGELADVPAELLDGDADTLGGLISCADGGIAVFDLGSGLWGCGVDAVLDGPAVLGFIDGEVVDLGVGSTVGGVAVATVDDLVGLATLTDLDWDLLVDIPGGFADGEDADTLAGLGPLCADSDRPSWDLVGGAWTCAPDAVPTEDEVEDMILDEPLDLPAGSTIDGSEIATGAGGLFGGTGDDGPLVITAGTTTLDLGGAQYFVRNYSSIEISGTGQLSFINPHDSGTVIVLRSAGDTTLTSAASPNVDLRGLGGAPTDENTINPGTGAESWLDGSSSVSGVRRAYKASWFLVPIELTRSLRLASGAGGRDGLCTDLSPGGAGGRGGGSLVLEVGGSLDFSGSIDASGEAGSAATGCCAGGGGGSAGRVVILFNDGSAGSGTVVNIGGEGGPGSSTGCPSLNTCCGHGAGGFGGVGGDDSVYDPSDCTWPLGVGGGGGAGGSGPGAEGLCEAPGAGGTSGNNLIQQNSLFP